MGCPPDEADLAVFVAQVGSAASSAGIEGSKYTSVQFYASEEDVCDEEAV